MLRITKSQVTELKRLALLAVTDAHNTYVNKGEYVKYTNSDYPDWVVAVEGIAEGDNKLNYQIQFRFKVISEFGTFLLRIALNYYPNRLGIESIKLVTKLESTNGELNYNLTILLPIFSKILEKL